VICSFENVDVPRSDLRYDRTWGWVHTVDPEHTVLGTLLGAAPTHGLPPTFEHPPVEIPPSE
jgi:hypothetical protein